MVSSTFNHLQIFFYAEKMTDFLLLICGIFIWRIKAATFLTLKTTDHKKKLTKNY